MPHVYVTGHKNPDTDTIASAIAYAEYKNLVEAGIAIKDVEYAYCGIAGSDHPVHRQRVVDSLSIFFPRGNFIVDTDARVALTGAIGFGAIVAVHVLMRIVSAVQIAEVIGLSLVQVAIALGLARLTVYRLAD